MPSPVPGPCGPPIYCRPMRRWLMILLLFAMPFQLSWAAAAGYCQHESHASASHFGHHEHHHVAATSASAQDTDTPSDPLPGGPDNDCLTCHTCTVQPLAHTANVAATAGPAARPAPFTESYRSHVGGIPTRPAWPALA